ncbi:ribosome maturation factor RimP [Plantactinospora mayteni]|uniref:Ribosome maturation factor RimP n=1 Tax=Plantactinospora mayteni TaxID=566021 RepID=A0ABQ4EQ54_9ACTN|nr:ribosome maturation factor RimP [Plantactinospora mayteni]
MGHRAPDRPREDSSARRLRLRAVIEPVITAAGYDLEDLSVSRAGRRYVVRVVVDGDGGVSLDAVADVSRLLSKALDQAEETGGDLVAGEYQLEVSSPGVDRPLTQPRHWRRNVGRLVKVTVRGPGKRPEQRGAVDGRPSTVADRQLTARVIAADDERVMLETDAGPVGWAYPDLGPGRVQVEFSRLDEIADDDPTGAGDDDYDDVGNGDDEDVEGEER